MQQPPVAAPSSAAARSKRRSAKDKGRGPSAAAPPISFRGLGCLSEIEVSLIMQFCDCRSILRLARCSRIMIRSAGSEFSWRCAEPFVMHSALPDYMSAQGLGLVEYARTGFQWRPQSRRFHTRIGKLLDAHTQLIALDLAFDAAEDKEAGSASQALPHPPLGSEASLMLALGHPSVGSSLRSLSLRACGRYTQMSPTLLRTILAFPSLTSLALRDFARPADPERPDRFSALPLLRSLLIEDRMDARNSSMLSYFGGSPLLDDLRLQSPSCFGFDFRPMSERSYAGQLRRLVFESAEPEGPEYRWSPNEAFASILPDREAVAGWFAKLVALEDVRISFVPIEWALAMLALLPAMRRVHVSASLTSCEASIPSLDSVALLLSSCPLLLRLSLSVHVSSNCCLVKKELKARAETIRQRFLPLPPKLAQRFECTIILTRALRDQ